MNFRTAHVVELRENGDGCKVARLVDEWGHVLSCGRTRSEDWDIVRLVQFNYQLPPDNRVGDEVEVVLSLGYWGVVTGVERKTSDYAEWRRR